jgi:hypothetical protein
MNYTRTMILGNRTYMLDLKGKKFYVKSNTSGSRYSEVSGFELDYIEAFASRDTINGRKARKIVESYKGLEKC